MTARPILYTKSLRQREWKLFHRHMELIAAPGNGVPLEMLYDGFVRVYVVGAWLKFIIIFKSFLSCRPPPLLVLNIVCNDFQKLSSCRLPFPPQPVSLPTHSQHCPSLPFAQHSGQKPTPMQRGRVQVFLKNFQRQLQKTPGKKSTKFRPHPHLEQRVMSKNRSSDVLFRQWNAALV